MSAAICAGTGSCAPSAGSTTTTSAKLPVSPVCRSRSCSQPASRRSRPWRPFPETRKSRRWCPRHSASFAIRRRYSLSPVKPIVATSTCCHPMKRVCADLRGCLNPIPGFFFDMEGDPLEEGGLEYLFGLYFFADGRPEFKPFWAHHRAEEKRAFEAFMDFVTARLRGSHRLTSTTTRTTSRPRSSGSCRSTARARSRSTICFGRAAGTPLPGRARGDPRLRASLFARTSNTSTGQPAPVK